MFSRKMLAGAPVFAAGALALGLAAPSAALAQTHHAKFTADVKAAHTALATVRTDAHSHAAIARRALRTVTADSKQAAIQALSLSGSGATTEATGLSQIASLFSQEASTFTSLLGGSSSSLQAPLAGQVAPAVSAETFFTGLLNDLAGKLPSGSASGALSTVGSLMGQASSQLSTLSSLLDGGTLPAELQQLLGTALTTTSGAVDAIVAQLEALVPDLPTADQASATALLTQLQSLFDSSSSTLSTVTSTTGSQLGSTFTTQLGGLGDWLSKLMSMLTSTLTGLQSGSGMPTIGSTTGTSTGTGTGGSSTSTGFPSGLSSIFQLPAGLTSLLSQFGFGSMPF